MSFQNTISGKEFCKKNCGNISKERFYEEYYRIIHTAYLRCGSEPCIDVIKNDFISSFGTELDNISISYIYATAKYFVYDVVVNSLLKDGKIDSQYYYNKLVIDLGFDVWLIKCIEEGTSMTMNDFMNWQPLEKSDKTERNINDFWHFRLPKSHNFGHLYSGIYPYKKMIFETYRKLLLANTSFEIDDKAKKTVLEYINGAFPVESQAAAKESQNIAEEKTTTVEIPAPEVTAAVLDENEIRQNLQAEEKLAAIVEEVKLSDAVTEIQAEDQAKETEQSMEEPAAEQTKTLQVEDEQPEETENQAENTDFADFDMDVAINEFVEEEDVADDQPEEPVKPAEPVKAPVLPKIKVVDEAPKAKAEPYQRKIFKPEPIKKQSTGFREGSFSMTKKKAVTAAVCVGLAGVLLIPLAVACLGKGRKKR